MLKRTLNKLRGNSSSHFLALNTLHILNDGYQASYLLFLPFIAATQDLSLTQVGTLGTLLKAAGIVLALPAGYIAGKIGGLKTLVIALFMYGISLLGVGLLAGYHAMLFAFVLGGVGFGVFHPIGFALIAKWAPKETRGRSIGNFTATGDIGRIGISAALSFIAVGIGWQQTAVLYAAVALVIGLGFYRFLIAQRDIVHQDKQEPIVAMKLWQVVKNKRFLAVMGACAMDAFASSAVFVFLPFLLLQRDISPAFLGTFAGIFFIGNLLGKVTLGRFVDKFGSAKVFIIAELLMAGFIFLLAHSTAVSVIVLCAAVLGILTKGTVPVLQTMVTESTEHHGNYDKAFGVEGLVSSVALTLAPITLGLVSDQLNLVQAFNVMAIVAAAAIIPAGLFFMLSKRPASRSQPSS